MSISVAMRTAKTMKVRPFSRHMPPAPTYPIIGWPVLTVLAVGLITVAFIYPIPILLFFLFVSVVTLIGSIASRIDTRRKLALAASRRCNPLCAFARSLNLRSVDPWVVRAAFEELQPYFPEESRPFPILPTDRLVDDVGIDPDEVDDIAQDIAARAGYSLDHSQENPVYGRVDTIGDLIQFFTHQPILENRASEFSRKPS
jgi:hypothetical protein